MANREASAEGVNDNATARASEDRASKGGGIVDLIFQPFEMLGNIIGKAAEAIVRDGTLEAAGRQGLDELGAALKAFPDSIQVQEAGTVFNPTPGEVQKSRDPETLQRSYSSLTPPRSAEADEQKQYQYGNDHGQSNGQDTGMSM
jgi:hypothetical protein